MFYPEPGPKTKLKIAGLSALSIAVVMGLGLSACAHLPVITLASAQAEVMAIDTAVKDASPALIAILPIGVQPAAQLAVLALNTAAEGFDALGASATSTTQTQKIAEFVTAADNVVNDLGMPADTKAAIEAGIALVQSFSTGTPAILPPVTASTVAPSVGVTLIPGPIAIPVHTYDSLEVK